MIVISYSIEFEIYPLIKTDFFIHIKNQEFRSTSSNHWFTEKKEFLNITLELLA